MNNPDAIPRKDADDRPRSVAPADAPAVTPEAFRDAIVHKLVYAVGKDRRHALDHDWLIATALATRDQIVERWMEATRRTYRDGRKRVYYFSLEFLIGRLLLDALGNLGLVATAREALAELGVDFDRLRRLEPDAALGNGGLGRLAACFMESMSTLGIPAHGYGIRYDHGIFRQAIKDGWQIELPEDWLSSGNPWEFERPEVTYTIGFGGTVDAVPNADGTTRSVWRPAESVNALAFDTPIVGWRGRHVNTLRLWSARAGHPIVLEDFNRGDHVGALADRVRLEAISRVLYPSDDTPAGHELRLRQEIFFASASLQDLLRRHKAQHGEVSSLPDHVSIQLNDTHPAIAVPELMRLLVDEHGMPWDLAWRITTAVFSYTNHTLLPEALEKWSVPLMEGLLPRHMQIIYLINALHLKSLRDSGRTDPALVASLSLIEENHTRQVRMGNLAFLGSRRVNGVSALHTELMRKTVFRDFNAVYPDRIVNKTNGITFRRWLFQANPGLTNLIAEAVGPEFTDDTDRLSGPRPLRGRRGLPRAVRRRAPLQQGAARAHHRGAHRRERRPGDALRRPDQAHPRVQAPAPEPAGDHRPLQRDARPPRHRLGAAREDLRGQGRGRLHAGQAHHQARQRRRARRQPRPGPAGPAEGRVPAQLQREPRRVDHPGRGPLGADLDGRAWRPPAPAT